MAMVTIGKDGWLNLNANEISSVKFTPKGWDGFGARAREVPGKTIIEMRNGTRHELAALTPESRHELMLRIREAQT